MLEDESKKLTREQLYNEIWEISVAGVAKKYNASYYELLKRCKEANIPVPKSGYWTKLSFGKSVTQTPLPELQIGEVEQTTNITTKRLKHSAINATTTEKVPATQQGNKGAYRAVSGKFNTYNREKLYEEVWEKPVVDVAVQYGVSDVAIHKICKSLNVPVPPRGYWAKLHTGKKLEKTPLASTKGATEKIGMKSFEGDKQTIVRPESLYFLEDSERQKVVLAAQQIKMKDETSKLHKKIVNYRSVVTEWNKKDTKPEMAQRGLKNYSNYPPFLAGVVSSETLPRLYRILDALYTQIEVLGGIINEDLSLQIRNENVHLEVVESQDEIKHVITKQEARDIITYEDELRRYSWASKPNIRKYDYVFNGRLRIGIRQGRYFRDTDKINIESQLGDILLDLYEESEVVRIDREKHEEVQRKREEEERLREERLDRYNGEVDRTNALTNSANDYDLACKIRAYILALESNGRIDEGTSIWIAWANKKADWFDPIIARSDELLGKRDHTKCGEEKILKRAGYYRW